MEKFTLKNLCEALPNYIITTNDQKTRIIINKVKYTRHEIQNNFTIKKKSDIILFLLDPCRILLDVSSTGFFVA